MDYLQEMARRQQAVLTRLLTGGRSREETAAEEEPSRTRERPGTEGEVGAALRGTGYAAAAAENAEQSRLAPGETGAETVRPSGEAELLRQAEQFRETRQADALWRDAVGSAGSLPGILMPGGGHPAAEAEEISRAVQRDARRYDGGFTMF